MDKELDDLYKNGYKCASWAIWNIPLSDMSDYDKIKDIIKPNIVMVALNATGEIEEDFKNFHNCPGNGKQTNDEKLKYAFEDEDTAFKGAYMTDIIKFHTIKGKVCKASSSDCIMKYLKKYPEVEQENIEIFKCELRKLDELRKVIDSNSTKIIIAFGDAVCKILSSVL